MKTIKFFLLASTAACLSAVSAQTMSFFGPGTTGGGFAVVCQNPQGEITSVELLDSYEAKLAGKTIVSPSRDNAGQAYAQLAQRAYGLQGNPEFFNANEALKEHEYLLGLVKWSTASEMKSTNDVGQKPSLSEGCDLEQLAVFQAEGLHLKEIQINQSLYQKLSAIEKAGLLYHETFHVLFRNSVLRDQNSMAARQYVGALLSNETLSLRDGLSGNEEMFCFAKSVEHPSSATTFYVVGNHSDPAKVDSLRIQFQGTAALPLTEKSYADIGLDTSFAVSHRAQWLPGIPFSVATGAQVSPYVKVEKIVPLTSSYGDRFQIGISYETGAPIRIDLIDNGMTVDRSFITSCKMKK